MKQIIILQSAVLSICAAVAFAVWGFAGFLSAVGGGLSYLLPTFVAVLLLKLFRGKPLPAKQDVRLRRDFKSSAVAVVHARRICCMASIVGVRPVSDGAARCQPFGFFSIVESERLWQVKPLPLPTTSSTTCRA